MSETVRLTALPQSSQNVIETVKEYGKRLFGFIRKRVNSNEDAEDILQDVWYQLTLLDNGPIEQLGAWLYRVAQNKIIDRYRKQKTGIPRRLHFLKMTRGALVSKRSF